MKIIVEVLIDEAQWPTNRLLQYVDNIELCVGSALEQTVWYHNDIAPDVEISVRTEQ